MKPVSQVSLCVYPALATIDKAESKKHNMAILAPHFLIGGVEVAGLRGTAILASCRAPVLLLTLCRCVSQNGPHLVSSGLKVTAKEVWISLPETKREHSHRPHSSWVGAVDTPLQRCQEGHPVVSSSRGSAPFDSLISGWERWHEMEHHSQSSFALVAA